MDSTEKYAVYARQYWLPIFLGCIGLIFLIYGLIGFKWHDNDDGSEILFKTAQGSGAIDGEESEGDGQELIVVDVAGAVEKPGVYRLVNGSRVHDALIAAGGLSIEADRENISANLNLASKLVDGGKIYIPFAGDNIDIAGTPAAIGGISYSGGGGIESKSLIDINSASDSDLDSLPGIGPVTSKKIIDNRPYTMIEDLIDRKIVGNKVFEDIKGKIVAR